MEKLERITSKILVFIVLVLLGACATSTSTRSLPMPKIKKLSSYIPRQVEEWQLDNGLKVFYLPDDELPIIRGALYIPGGTLSEIPDKPALISMLGSQMRQGGAGSLDADQLDLELEKLAASVSSDYSTEYGSFGFSCLSSDFDRVFSIFSDVVLSPRFDLDRLDLAKGQSLEGIRRRRDDPSNIAGLASRHLLFGDNFVGRVLASSDIKSISRVDLLRAHRLFVQPEGAILAVTGKIDREKMNRAISERFANWKNLSVKPPAVSEYSYKPQPGIYFVTEQFEQSTVYIGQQGPTRLADDYVGIEGFNTIFGGGDFGSRLMTKIRTDQGLAYSVYGSILQAKPVGQNIMVLQTKAQSVSDAIEQSILVLSDMQKNLVNEEELEQAKMAIQNSFIFKLDTTDDLIRRHALLRLLNYPADYDATYVSKVNALERQDIKEVANKYWDISKLVIVVVGNENAYNLLKERATKEPDSFAGLGLFRCSFNEKLEACP